MNIVTAAGSRMAIEVVHDLVCPWCFLGHRRLMRTLRRRPELLYDLTWRPFLLNPDMPRAGVPRSEYVIRKFGGEDRARRLYASITEIGRNEDIDFHFERIKRTPSSVDAHRLVRFAARYDFGMELVEALFAAHFTDGRDIGDLAVLVEIAAVNGLNAIDTQIYLRGETDVEVVHAENLRAHRIGINGVPCFVIGERHAIAGAQESEVIERLIDVALVDSAS